MGFDLKNKYVTSDCLGKLIYIKKYIFTKHIKVIKEKHHMIILVDVQIVFDKVLYSLVKKTRNKLGL